MNCSLCLGALSIRLIVEARCPASIPQGHESCMFVYMFVYNSHAPALLPYLA